MNKQLEVLKYAVDQWRLNPSTKLNKVPEDLKNQIIQFIPAFKPDFLAKYFGFGVSTIGKWKRELSPSVQDIVHQEFVELTRSSIQQSIQSQLISVKFKRGEIEVEAQLSSEQFQHFFLIQGV